MENENMTPRPDRQLESRETLSSEMNLRLSQEIDPMISMIHAQMNTAINSAMSDQVTAEIQ